MPNAAPGSVADAFKTFVHHSPVKYGLPLPATTIQISGLAILLYPGCMTANRSPFSEWEIEIEVLPRGVTFEVINAVHAKRYKKLGGDITVIVEDNGHRHGTRENVKAVLDFIRKHTRG